MLKSVVHTALMGLLVIASQVFGQDKPTFEQTTRDTQYVAEPYFAAYVARDWDKLGPLLSEDGSFSDPTAKLVFGAVKYAGKSATLKAFRENYASIKHMEFKPHRVFFSGEHAVFEGTLDWTLSLGEGKEAVTDAMSLITILRVVGGKVVEHQDFADYAPFLAAVRKAKAGQR